ncbi:MAG: aminoacyl-tRNA hydrolase [Bacteroidia bacterium]|nr:aminoacyl-tRNA hydrolase [Bacteroidia bacterium]
MLTDAQEKSILRECKFHTSRSGGKGGQNVNKVETKVEIEFDLRNSLALSEEQKTLLMKKHSGLIDDSFIKITAVKYRSQLENKEEAKKKLIQLINRLLKPVKKRVATKPGKKAKETKLQNKKHTSEKKSLRRKISDF